MMDGDAKSPRTQKSMNGTSSRMRAVRGVRGLAVEVNGSPRDEVPGDEAAAAPGLLEDHLSKSRETQHETSEIPLTLLEHAGV